MHYDAEVVMTNVGDVAISVPIGKDADSLLVPTQHDRMSLLFSDGNAKSGKTLA